MSKLRDAVYGFAVGDALGLPYEYKERGSFTCTCMTGGGTWNQEKGTFSDDTSVLLATCASIKKYGRINCLDMMRRLSFWLYRGDYTPDGRVINVGASTLQAINLGGDTDTIGALAGGLAGMKYGFDSIPEQWIKDLRRKDLIEENLF